MPKPEPLWNILSPDAEAARLLAERLGITPIAGQILINRGVSDPEDAHAFLYPELADLHDPSFLPELEQSASRIRQAVEGKEKIVIYGDYDVDGISATAILMRCLALLGCEAEYYVPDRVEEGYGLNADAVRALAEQGTNVIVTVDCGVSAVAEAALAGELGIDLIITDHHEPGDEVPINVILIDPKLPGCPYPFRDLSGAGLAFKLAWAIGKTFSDGDRVSSRFRTFLLDAVSLAALGTIADVVPLHGENRALAHYGLKGLSASDAPGVTALREASSLDGKEISSFEVAFRIAPRLNAAGRMGSARQAVELLTTPSLDRAREIVDHLGRENSRRQRLQEKILLEAGELLAAAGGVEGRQSIVLAKEGWHAGVLGIVAAKLAERHWRPAVVLTLEGDTGHGSARAVAPVHLFDALHACSDRLIGFGGHARAAGLRIRTDELARFKTEFEAAVALQLGDREPTPILDIDTTMRFSDMSRRLLDDINRIAPFGEGNRPPMLASFDVDLPASVRRMGTGGQHLSFYGNQNGVALRCVAFGLGEWADALARAGRCDIAYIPRINRYRGDESIELDVRDIKIG